jgi:succinylarginine dihydrolase
VIPPAVEANADGLIGPTHSYAGLSPGNLASGKNRGLASNPKAAVLQGLQKMRLLADLGLPQFVLPPQERPDIAFLRSLGFVGSDATVLADAWRDAPAFAAA